jgi:hypothetical protein
MKLIDTLAINFLLLFCDSDKKSIIDDVGIKYIRIIFAFIFFVFISIIILSFMY